MKVLIFAISGFVVAALVYLFSVQILASVNSFRGSAIEPSPVAMDFSLQAADGSTFHLTEEQGKVVLIYFGYTNCPDFCPATLAKFHNIYQRLGDDTANVDFVFVSVDPQRDTPQVAADFVKGINEDFIGLSGTEDELRPIWQGYYVGPQIVPMEGNAIGYMVDHTTRVYVIDKQGNWRLTFPFEMNAEDMAHDVSLLLAEN